MKDNTYDVILVGGGVMGCATATYLLKADDRLKVAIIEKDLTYARASTPLSDGNTRIQFNVKENIQMSLYGLQVLDNFAEEMAVGDDKPDVAFRQQGDLFLVDEDGCEEAQAGLALQQSLNCQVEWLTPEMLEEQYPLFNLEGCVGGTFGPQDGTMDPHAMLIAYKKKAESLGATIIEAEVAELLKEGSCMSGVRLSSGEVLSSGYIVNTAGAWATRLTQTIGINLPVQATKRQVFVIDTPAQPKRPLPLIFFPSGLYMIQEHGGVFLCGKSLPNDPIGTQDFSWELQIFTDYLWPELVTYVPSFDRLKVLRGWAGLYAVNSFDGNAILGEWPAITGLFLANGFSGHGFQQCHAVGRYLSELITGQAPALDLSIFSPQRILDNRPVFESKRKLV